MMEPGALEKLGPYTLIEQIAVGGMAEIYLAKTRGVAGFEKLLCLKVIHPNYADDQTFIEMLIDEAKICVGLNHANIVQIFDLGRDGKTYFIAMEYISGADLFRVMRSLSEREIDVPIDVATYIAHEVCTGLDYAHRKRDDQGRPLGIIHRDISPQNILLSHSGEVKIVDFGIAKAARRSRRTQAGVIKGKYFYMSPEQAWGDPIDQRSDIFSAGIILYEVLTGQMLYLEEDMHLLLDMVRKANIAPPSTLRPDIPPQLEHVVMKALAKRPADRWQTAHELQVALANVLFTAVPDFTPHRVADLLHLAVGQPEPPPPSPAAVSAPTPPRRGPTREVELDSLMSRVDYQPRTEHSVIFELDDLGAVTDHGEQEPDDDEEGRDERTLITGPPSMFAPTAMGNLSAALDWEDQEYADAPKTIRTPQHQAPSRRQRPSREVPDEVVVAPSDLEPLDDTASSLEALDDTARRLQAMDHAPAPSASAPPPTPPPGPAAQSAGPAAAAGGVAGGPWALEQQLEHDAPQLPPTNPTHQAVHDPTAGWNAPPAAPAELRGAQQPGWPTPRSAAPQDWSAAQPLVQPQALPDAARGAPGGGQQLMAQHPLEQGQLGWQGVGQQQPLLGNTDEVLRNQASRRHRRVALALLLTVLGLGGVATALLIRAFPRKATTGTLEVISVPEGAQVTVNGEPLAKRTPLVVPINDLKRTHRVSVSLPNYQPWHRELMLTPEEPRLRLLAVLTPIYGRLKVRSIPPGADVYVNGRHRGKTPTTVENLIPSGELSLELRKPGFRPDRRELKWGGQTYLEQQIQLQQ